MTSSATEVGIMPPPPGVEPDFSGSRTSLQSRIIVVYVIMTVLSTVVLALRLHTRIFIRRTTGLDDVLVVLSWFGCVAWLVIGFEAFQYGFGQHLWNVTPAQLPDYMRMLVGIIVVLLNPVFADTDVASFATTNEAEGLARTGLRTWIWRSNEKSYELGSAEADKGNNKLNRQIAVTRSYSVRDSNTGKSSGGSMDELFAPSAGWNGGR
ncbi:integral membrane protein [Stemphylium lycopersici]|nr:hypothetical protein TW65_01517 [Stemphylium lycopersici]RAR11346.1 integral membrane protein [Stemphylium lycopersici]